VLKGLTKFKEMARVQVDIGLTCQFWLDKWGTEILQNKFPQAFSFAKDKQINVRKAFDTDNITDLFNLPLSEIAFQQIQEIQQQMQMSSRNELQEDIWTYFAQNSNYRAQTAYTRLMGQQPIQPILKWLWKSYCQPKHKVFFWLLLKDRLSTKNILRRRKMQLDSYTCAFCTSGQEESIHHLFWECTYAQQCWGTLEPHILQNGDTTQNTQALRIQLRSQFSMIAIILMSWTIWKARNEATFNNRLMSIQECKRAFF